MKKYGFGLVVLLLAVVGTGIAYPYLPDKIAVHWNYRGAPDQFSEKSLGVFLLPAIMLVIYVFTIILPKIDPKKSNYQRFETTYFRIMNGILLFLLIFQAVQITSSLKIVNPTYVVPILVGLLFIFIGNLSPKFKPNYFMGIRTPWTLASEEVWKKTHRFGGKVFVIAGLLMVIMPVIPAAVQVYYFTSVIVISLACIVLSSYYFFIKPE